MSITRGRTTRLLAAAFLVIPLTVLSFAQISSAAPTEEEVQSAKAQLEQLEHDMEVVIEQYNEANYRLSLAKERLADAKIAMQEAQDEAEEARTRLSDRAVDAYTGMGSQLDILLDANNFSEFSDRLEFMGAIAQSDAELATAADLAGQRAEWAAEEYASAVAEAQARVDQMRDSRERIEGMLEDQQALYETLNQEYADYVAAQEAALAAAEQAEDEAEDPNGTWNAPPPPPPPPSDGTAASTAVNAAYSALGSPYVFGAMGPSAFDCSGLTAWAWLQAGVSIPHSAASQWSSLPQVPLSSIVPGDIIYYNSSSSHVALFVGNGQIIHARHPGPGGEVQLDGLYAYDHPIGAVRPG